MKKLLVLALALIMALSLAAPALAFTDVEYDESDVGPELAIKLVDVSDGFVTVNFNAPPSNRGYLKNEVVCAVVSLFVPKEYDFSDNGYTTLEFTGTNVSLYQDDNFYGVNNTTAPAVGADNRGTLRYMSNNAASRIVNTSSNQRFYYLDMSIDNKIVLDSEGLGDLDNPALKVDTTFHFAIFGKVLSEDAFMSAKLNGTGALVNATDGTGAAIGDADEGGVFNFVNTKGDYWVGYFNPNADAKAINSGAGQIDPADAAEGAFASGVTVSSLADVGGAATANAIQLGVDDILYYVRLKSISGVYSDSEALFAIVTDKKYNCKAMYVCDTSTTGASEWYQVKVVSRDYSANTVYSKAWGQYVQFESCDASGVWTVSSDATTNAFLRDYVCEDIIWEEFGLNPALKGQMKDNWWAVNKGIEVEVAVEPWYAEITVPSEIELDPPKTGDVVSALGFVLVAIAGMALVAVRKVKA